MEVSIIDLFGGGDDDEQDCMGHGSCCYEIVIRQGLRTKYKYAYIELPTIACSLHYAKYWLSWRMLELVNLYYRSMLS